MKKSLLPILFLAVSAFSFFQCQKDNSNQNLRSEPVQQELEERGSPCPITVTGNVAGNVCGTNLNNALCVTCGGLNGAGSSSFPSNGSVTFYPSTLIFSVRNIGPVAGNYTISNVNGAINFQLPAGGCRDFSMLGCDIF